MDDLINTLLGALVQAIPIVASIATGAWALVRAQAGRIENDFLRGITDRTVQVADSVTGAAFGRMTTLMEAARLAESDGGPQITKNEWERILDTLWNDFKAGFGQNWMTRAGQVIGVVEFERSARSEIEAQLVSKLDDKRSTTAGVKAALTNAAVA